MPCQTIRLNDMYETISGEAGIFPQGSWCTIIRMQGCNMRCPYCDTPQALDPNKGLPANIDEIVEMVSTNKVMITGGEPLYQKNALFALVAGLESKNKEVQIETNGTLHPIDFHYNQFKERWVVDYKLFAPEAFPSTQFAQIWKMRGVVKFVVGDSKQWFEAAFSVMKDLLKVHPFTCILSPMNANASIIHALVEWVQTQEEERGYQDILRNNVVFSLQVHKLVNMK